jgi:hypothetical protein
MFHVKHLHVVEAPSGSDVSLAWAVKLARRRRPVIRSEALGGTLG